MAASAGQQDLSDALNRLWAQFLPQMSDRVAVMERAIAELAAGNLSIDQRGEANSAAHKLAGVLGTFGLTRGTVLAREAEMIFASESENYEGMVPRLREIAAQLRAMIEQRK